MSKPLTFTFPLLMLSLVLSSCASTGIDVRSVRETDSLLVKHALAENEAILLELGNFTDQFSRYEQAKAHYQIALNTHDRPSTNKAIEIFEALLDEPRFVADVRRSAELNAYYGSAYTLKARDFPGLWIVNNLTPVGYIRIYYVWRGKRYLNRAVDIEPSHPVVRLIRANTLVNIPRVFGQFARGREDFALLRKWMENPEENERYEMLLRDERFYMPVYFSLAEFYRIYLSPDQAREIYEKIIRLSPHSVYAEAARTALNTLQTS
ncbi:MAG: hypothetical protein OEZ43_17910 [Gammaproteobacteria bacterium]|nr:hypothetical protein [Gammaproteobacteria bacterium]